jgi:hypothetical protein
MKTFSDEALAALQRGDAIVSASVEIIPLTSDFTTTVQFEQDFSNGLANFALDTGSLTGFTIVTDTDLGQALQVAPGPNDIDAIAQAVGDKRFSDITVKFKVTATDADDDGVMELRDSSGNVVLNFNPGRQPSIDPDRRPSVSFFDDPGGTAHLLGTTAVTTGTPYEFHAALNSGGTAFDLTITDLTDSSVFATATVSVSTRTPVSKLRFRTDNFSGSGTVRWADVVITLDADAVLSSPIRLWGGCGNAELPSDAGTSTFKGIGDRGLIQSSGGAIGGTAQNLTLALSGIEPEAIAVLDPEEVRGASVVVRRLIFDSAGKTLLGGYVYTRGRLDELKTTEVVGGGATIALSVEGAARGLGRRGGRARSDADQRLVSSTDGFYRAVSAAPKKTLYWGGKTPSIGGSLTGGGGVAVSTSSSSVLGVSK